MSDKKHIQFGELELTEKEFFFLVRHVRFACSNTIFRRHVGILNAVSDVLSGHADASGLSISHWLCVIKELALYYRSYHQLLEDDEVNDVHLRRRAGLCLSVMFKLEQFVARCVDDRRVRRVSSARQRSLFDTSRQEVSHA